MEKKGVGNLQTVACTTLVRTLRALPVRSSATKMNNERSDRSITGSVKTKTHDNGLETVVCRKK